MFYAEIIIYLSVTDLLNVRHICSLLVVFLIFSSVNSQTLVQEGNTWDVADWDQGGSSWTITYTMTGDTLINGIAYKQVLQSSTFNNDSLLINAVLRQEGEQVYFLFTGGLNEQEELLYDFSLEVGDTIFYQPPSCDIYVSAINSIELENETFRKTWEFSSVSSNNIPFAAETWIEGIGSVGGLFRPHSELYCVQDINNTSLSCFHENGAVLYTAYSTCIISDIDEEIETEVFLYPNPSCLETKVSSQESVNTANLYDLSGRLALNEHSERIDLSKVSEGIYFAIIELNNGEVLVEKLLKQCH